MKIRFLLTSALCLLTSIILPGCTSTNPAITKALLTATVSTGVSLGAAKSPETVPFIRAADQVICAAANSTNISPTALTAAIEAAPQAAALKTTEGTIILNFALSAYMILWDQYGGNVKNTADLQGYLQATCDGINLGLPGTATTVKMLTRPRIR